MSSLTQDNRGRQLFMNMTNRKMMKLLQTQGHDFTMGIVCVTNKKVNNGKSIKKKGEKKDFKNCYASQTGLQYSYLKEKKPKIMFILG